MKRIDTTLGELIEAVSEAAFEYCEDSQEAYIFTQAALAEILKRYYSGQGGSIPGLGSPRKAHLN
jgi:hypothetical protein